MTQLFLITDIFGVNPSILELQNKLLIVFDQVTILDPYQNAEMNFESEHDAYSEFVKLTGHDEYFSFCKEEINASNSSKWLLGFSAGASVCWRLSNELTPKNTHQAIAFYPSQIRHYLSLQPKINTTIIFPKSEETFSVEEVILLMQKKQKVSTLHSKYSHGFMNPSSMNYSKMAFKHYLGQILNPEFFKEPSLIVNNSEES